MQKVSVIIVAYNEADKLAKCLKSVAGFSDETILYDLGGDAETKQLADKYKLKHVVKPRGNVRLVEEVRQATLALAEHEYVLILDPDEELSRALANKLRQLINEDTFAAVSIPRQNYVFGKWIKRSRWWPDHQIRLVKKSLTNWPTTIHAVPIIDGPIYELPSDPKLAIIHHNYQDLTDYLTKNFRYAQAEAARALTDGQPITLPGTLQRSVSEFISRFFFDQGYRDGMHGFVLAFLQLTYYYLVLFFYWEKRRYQELVPEKSLVLHPLEFFRHGLKETIHWTEQAGHKSIKNKLVKKFL